MASNRLSKAKVALGHWLCHPAVGRQICSLYNGLVPHGGNRYSLKTGDRVAYRQAASLFWGLYEKSERQLIQRFLRPDLDVI